jgi:hypothetical protein
MISGQDIIGEKVVMTTLPPRNLCTQVLLNGIHWKNTIYEANKNKQFQIYIDKAEVLRLTFFAGYL